MKLSNWLHGLWKGIGSVLAALATAGGIHVFVPSCTTAICMGVGATAMLTVWSGLAGVGVKPQS